MTNNKMVMPRSTAAKADAKPQFTISLTWDSMAIEIITSVLPPKRDGVIKNPIPIMKTRRQPAPTPGRLSGKKIFHQATTGLAPKFSAAFKRFRSMPFMIATSGRIIKGKNTFLSISPKINALKGGPFRPRSK